MNYFTKVFSVLFLLFIYSCEKDPKQNNTIVFGRVVDYLTTQPVNGAIVYSLSQTPYSNHYDTTIITHTDNDGKFEFKMKIDGTQSFHSFYVLYKNYFYGSMWVKLGTINNCNIRLAKYSYLKMHVRNTHPINSQDQFILEFIDHNSYLPSGFSFTGANVDTLYTAIVEPNKTHLIHWYSYKNSSPIDGSVENIYFTSGDTIHRSFDF